MIRLLDGKFMYLIWTIINIIQDTLYKYYNNCSFHLVMLGRHIFVLVLLIISENIFKFQNANSSSNDQKVFKSILLLNVVKSLTTFAAIFCLFKQMNYTDIFHTNLICYTIPFLDFIIGYVINDGSREPLYLTIGNFINTLIIGIYMCMSYNFKSYSFGLLSAVLFSINNVILSRGKKYWQNNSYFLRQDMKIFSCFMIIISLIYEYYFNNTIWRAINWQVLGAMSLNGVFIQLVLYHLFFSLNYSPTSFIIYCDLILSVLTDYFIGHRIPSKIQIILIVTIFTVACIYKKLRKKITPPS